MGKRPNSIVNKRGQPMYDMIIIIIDEMDRRETTRVPGSGLSRI